MRILIKGDEITEFNLITGTTEAKKLKLETAKSPKEITITWKDPKGEQSNAGIYSLANDELKICAVYADYLIKRPIDFATKEGDDFTYLRVYKRIGNDPTATLGFLKIQSDWHEAQESYGKASLNAKTGEEQRKVRAELEPKPWQFAARYLKLAESQPRASVALAALCWAAINAPASAPGKKALAMLGDGRVIGAELGELMQGLEMAEFGRSASRPSPLVSLALDAVKQQLDNPRAARVLAWVCVNYFDDESQEVPARFAEAAELIAARFAASPDIVHFCETLSHGPPAWAGKYEK